MSASRKSPLIRGFCIAGALLLCVALIFALRMGFSYDGKCGGFFSEVSAHRPCSLWSYMTGDVLAIAVVLGLTYWPLVLVLIAVAIVVGYFFGRRGRHSGAL
jgi:hypothetical protein